MKAVLSFLYSTAAYLLFVLSFTYAIAFVGGIVVPKTIDSGASVPLPEALLADLGLLALFGVQHSVMARRSFKRCWTRIVPPALERSTFVLAASAALALLLWQWRPIAEPVLWRIDGGAAVLLWTVFWLGWATLFASSFLIDHFELFGLRQGLAALTGRVVADTQFRTPLLYRYVRHPLYFGFVLGAWAAPVMSAGHLLFAAAMTAYILVGIWFEERDLIAQFGNRYRRYREQVGMLLPFRRSATDTGSEFSQP